MARPEMGGGLKLSVANKVPTKKIKEGRLGSKSSKTV